jgi:hypothetical protein
MLSMKNHIKIPCTVLDLFTDKDKNTQSNPNKNRCMPKIQSQVFSKHIENSFWVILCVLTSLSDFNLKLIQLISNESCFSDLLHSVDRGRAGRAKNIGPV